MLATEKKNKFVVMETLKNFSYANNAVTYFA